MLIICINIFLCFRAYGMLDLCVFGFFEFHVLRKCTSRFFFWYLSFMSYGSVLLYFVCISFVCFILHVCHLGLIIRKMIGNQEKLTHGNGYNIHLFVGRDLDHRDHKLLSIHLMRKNGLSEFKCLRLHLPGGTCHLLHLLMLFLMFFQEAPMTLHYFLYMQTMLLDTCGLKR